MRRIFLMMANSFSFDICFPQPRQVDLVFCEIFGCPEDGLRSVCDLDLPIDILKMCFYSKKTDVQLLSDFGIGQTFGEFPEDFDLPGRETRPSLCAHDNAPPMTGYPSEHQILRKPDATVEDLENAFDKHLEGDPLVKNTLDTGLQCLVLDPAVTPGIEN